MCVCTAKTQNVQVHWKWFGKTRKSAGIKFVVKSFKSSLGGWGANWQPKVQQ